MKVQLLAVPYDTARRGWRMGAGPEHLLGRGLEAHLGALGHEVACRVVSDAEGLPPAEIRTAFELSRRVAVMVRDARRAGFFPIVLSGNCGTASGTLSGLSPRRRAIFWFDAHGDLNTPATTTSGFLDGTSLATALGMGFQSLAASIPGFEAASAADVTLMGARDFDAAELEVVAKSGLAHLAPKAMSGLDAALRGKDFGDAVGYVHCDLDVLDPSVGQANVFPVPGGLSVEDVTTAIGIAGRRVPIGAAAITAYAPEFDSSGSICRAAFAIAAALIAAADASS